MGHHRWGDVRRPHTVEYDRNRLIALKRANYTCELKHEGCTTRATQADHIVRVADGGTDSVTNLRASCASCNAKQNYMTRANVRNPRRRPPEAHPGLRPTPGSSTPEYPDEPPY